MLALTYGLSDEFEDGDQEGSPRRYSFDRLSQCLQSSVDSCDSCSAESEAAAKALSDDLDLMGKLQSSGRYLADYVLQDPDASYVAQFVGQSTPRERSTLTEFTQRGLHHQSLAVGRMMRVNRLPFAEHWLRTQDHDWITSSLGSAAQMLHLVQVTLPEVLVGQGWAPKRFLDAGCGTGYVATSMALDPRVESADCLEYLKWVYKIAGRIQKRGLLDPLQLVNIGEGDDEAEAQKVLEKVNVFWGDATQMKSFTPDGELGPELEGAYDLVLFGLSITMENDTPEQVVEALDRALAPGGVLVAPVCSQDPAPTPDGRTRKCKGRWRAFRKTAAPATPATPAKSLADLLTEITLPYQIPSNFIVPWDGE